MDYASEEFQRNRKNHKKSFRFVLSELLQSLKSPTLKVETVPIKHECIEFLQHTDFRRDLKELFPDLIACIGQRYGQIELKGPASQVANAKGIINERVSKIWEKRLTQSQSDLVWHIVAKNRWNQFFSRQLSKEDTTARVSLLGK